MLLSAEHITRSLGARTLLENVCLYLDRGEKLGIIGANGTGKSTLLKILAGAEEPEEGEVRLDPNVRLGYLPQLPEYGAENTVLEQVLAGLTSSDREVAEHEAKSVLTRLGLIDFERKMGSLSGGERRRTALASVLVRPADVLLLDEPTNHLDAEMTAWLEEFLKRWRGALVMVTHDRYFLERVVDRMAEVENAGLTFYHGNYADYLQKKAELLEMAQASERKRQSLLRREYQWVMQGPKARGTKSRERLERYETLRGQAGPVQRGRVEISALSSRLGKKTIELEHVSKRYGEQTVIRNFSCILLRDDRVGIIGNNGSGKSTLLNLIAGELTPDEGRVEIGQTVRLGYFSQETPPMDPAQRVIDYIKEVGNYIETAEGTLSAGQLLEQFLFTGEQQYSPVGKLSGGEKRRLFLLSVLAKAPNVLLLDEPTNDLDIDTLTVLEDYLETFPGAVAAVSHDRYFLDKMAARTFLVDEKGSVTETPGGYSGWVKTVGTERTTNVTEAKKEKPRGEQRLRFSYQEQRQFDTIEEEIAGLERELADVKQEQMEKGSDYLALEKLQLQQSGLEEKLEEKMERWVYLNDLYERILAQKEREGER